jgi:uncharacterized protein YkwD
MRYRRRVTWLKGCGFFLLTVVLLGSTCSASEAASHMSPRPLLSVKLHQAVSSLLDAINQDRAARRIHPLALSARQSACSVRNSLRMMRQGAISHDEFPADVCVPYTWTGENVGVTEGSPQRAVLRLHEVMMKEGPCPHQGCPNGEYWQHDHYLNLIDPRFRYVGIGITASSGRVWLTEDFTN